MITKELAALMALRVYEQGVNVQENYPAFPYQDWAKLDNPLPVTDGFSYGVFKNTTTNEIVISYRGTDGAVGMMGADGASNLGLTLGQGTSQSTQAAKVYVKVLELYGSDTNGSNISFTGHSLGGGLAGLMSVWFNRPAIVFDPAPFQLAALFPGTVNDLINVLGGATPLALLNYQVNIIGSFASREAAVASHFALGEFLSVTRSTANTIYGTNTPYTFGNQNVGAFAMHSQALLVAGILSPAFMQATVTVQSSLPIIMSGTFYSKEPDGSTERNFVLDLIRSEQTTPNDSKLDNFAEDLQKLGTNLAGLSAKAQDALIAQGIEWYYWQGTNYAGQNFFIDNGQAGLLQYTSAVGAALPGALNKATTYTQKWLSEVYVAHGGAAGFPPFGTLFDQWSVATSSTAVTVTARDANKTQIYIGQGGGDTFTAGNAGDVILAGGGNDTLNGGTGYDLLYGGAGQDTYNFTGTFGGDKILDADGTGEIKVDGAPALTGGKKLSADLDIWESDNGLYRYSQMGGNLIITKGSKAGVDEMKGSITVQGWTAGQLGINLGSEVITAPEVDKTYNGDQRAPITAAGSSTYNWSVTTWAVDGTLTGGVATTGIERDAPNMSNLGINCAKLTNVEENSASGLVCVGSIAIVNIAMNFFEPCYRSAFAGNARADGRGRKRCRRRNGQVNLRRRSHAALRDFKCKA